MAIPDRRSSLSSVPRDEPIGVVPAMVARRRSSASRLSPCSRAQTAAAYPQRMRATKTRRASRADMGKPRLGAQVLEDLQIDVVARGLDPLGEAGPDARRDETTGDPPVAVAPLALEGEQLLDHDHVAFHPDDLADAAHLTGPIRQTAGVDDQVERGADLLPH